MMADIQLVVAVALAIFYAVSMLGLVLVVMLENRNPLKTIPWITVLLLLPGLGLVFYFFFGQDNRRRHIISRRTYKRIMRPLHAAPPEHDQGAVPDRFRPLTNLLERNRHYPLFFGSRITPYTDGPAKFEALLAAIDSARHHIHIQYYIFLDDAIGRRVRSALIAKARQGVKVRLLYDDVGSWNIHPRFFGEMREAGIEVYSFLRVVFPFLTSKVNYRNHRKVVVVDGRIGFMGGMNIADRYVDGIAWGRWRDTHFKIEGQGVHGLQSAFLIDWYVASRQLIKDLAYYPDAPVFSRTVMQVVTSGPIGPWRTLQQAFAFCISNAKRYIYLQTPYFLPTDSLNQALQTIALGGVDVRLMIPERADTKMAHMASCSFLEDLLRAGVKVYLYRSGFLHSKLLVMDDELVCFGSANFDFRSFEHNFEINAFVYDDTFAQAMKAMFLNDQQADCIPVDPSGWHNRPLPTRLAESFMRLFSPLL